MLLFIAGIKNLITLLLIKSRQFHKISTASLRTSLTIILK